LAVGDRPALLLLRGLVLEDAEAQGAALDLHGVLGALGARSAAQGVAVLLAVLPVGGQLLAVEVVTGPWGDPVLRRLGLRGLLAHGHAVVRGLAATLDRSVEDVLTAPAGGGGTDVLPLLAGLHLELHGGGAARLHLDEDGALRLARLGGAAPGLGDLRHDPHVDLPGLARTPLRAGGRGLALDGRRGAGGGPPVVLRLGTGRTLVESARGQHHRCCERGDTP